MGEFTEKEINMMDDIARRFQADIDLAEVAEVIHHPEFDPYDIQLEMLEDPSIHQQITPEIWAAIAVRQKRDIDWKTEQGDQEQIEGLMSDAYFSGAGSEASFGLQLIKDVGEFWRFKPTVEAIFELNDEQLEKMGDYAWSFKGSDHDNAIQGCKESLVEKSKQWSDTDLSTEYINMGLEMYEDCVKISERGFPNLLAMKRVMDGETPDMDLLQGKSASSVRRELTEDDPESNSVYFDLIVNCFESRLRNGIAHNDLVMDPGEGVVRIPTTGVSYSYDQVIEVVKENYASGVFLTGTFLSLVEWRAATRGVEGLDSIRPDWVFGERSVPENYRELVREAAKDFEESD